MMRYRLAGRFVVLAVLLTAISTCGLAATRLAGHHGSATPPGCPGLEVNSNMGFLLHTSLDDVAAPGIETSRYFVGVPGFLGLEDSADAGLADPCSTPSGAGDGVIDSRDLLCSWWSSRSGSMTVSRRDDAAQVWQSLTVRVDPLSGQREYFGDWTDPLIPNEAFVVTVGGNAVNPIAIAGSDDPMSNCRDFVLEPAGGDRTLLIYNSVYHTMHQHLSETLCGLSGVDFLDADRDFLPDSGCPAGLFDENSGARMTLTAMDYRQGSPTYARPVSFSVERDPLTGDLVFSGENLELIPGNAYLVEFAAPHSGTQACQPHF